MDSLCDSLDVITSHDLVWDQMPTFRDGGTWVTLCNCTPSNFAHRRCMERKLRCGFGPACDVRKVGSNPGAVAPWLTGMGAGDRWESISLHSSPQEARVSQWLSSASASLGLCGTCGAPFQSACRLPSSFQELIAATLKDDASIERFGSVVFYLGLAIRSERATPGRTLE